MAKKHKPMPRGALKGAPGKDGKCPQCGKADRMYVDLAGEGEKALACPCGYRYYGPEYPPRDGKELKARMKREKARIRAELLASGLACDRKAATVPGKTVSIEAKQKKKKKLRKKKKRKKLKKRKKKKQQQVSVLFSDEMMKCIY